VGGVTGEHKFPWQSQQKSSGPRRISWLS